jgi:hypothetical protein
VAVADALARLRRRAHAAAATLLVLVALDLGVLPLAALVSDQDNRAYAALRTAPLGRVLDLPLFEPGVHIASVYDYYALQAPRERLSGYSSLAPTRAFAFYFTFNRISCGVWLAGDEAFLRARGVEYVTFHRGLYAQGKVHGAWFGWWGLLEHGWAPRATDGAVTFLARGRSRAPAPVPEPPHSRPVFCEGWKGRTMDERQAPLWVYGTGPLSMRVGAPEPTRVALWVDGQRLPDADVSGERTLVAELPGQRWHSIVIEVPRLMGAAQPRGLRLYELGGG